MREVSSTEYGFADGRRACLSLFSHLATQIYAHMNDWCVDCRVFIVFSSHIFACVICGTESKIN